MSARDRMARDRRGSSRADNHGVVKLVAVEAFAELWLMPRRAAFRSAHPEIVIEFETTLGDHHELDPARRAFGIWIAFVAGARPPKKGKAHHDDP